MLVGTGLPNVKPQPALFQLSRYDPLAPNIGCWLFNDWGAPYLRDVSGNDLTGVFQNMDATNWFAGDYGAALNFDGGTEYVEAAYNALMNRINTAITAVAVVRVGDLSADGGVISRYNSTTPNRTFRFLLDSSERMSGYISTDGSSSGAQSWPLSSAISQDVWHVLAWVFEVGGACKNYIDGQLDSQGTLSAGGTVINNTGAAPVRFGMGYNTTAEPLAGDVAYGSLYDRALTAFDIERLTNALFAMTDFGSGLSVLLSTAAAAEATRLQNVRVSNIRLRQ